MMRLPLASVCCNAVPLRAATVAAAVFCASAWGVAHAGWDYLSWVDVVPESRWEIADLVEEGLLDSAVAEGLLCMTDDPPDLTLAPAEVFRATAGTWYGESVVVVERAREAGWFESLTETARESRLTPPELRRLRLLAQEPVWDPRALVRAPALAEDARLEVVTDPEGREDPAVSLRSRTDIVGTYRVGFLIVEDDEGDRFFRKYCLGMEPDDAMMKRAIIGTFRASFGEGLVLSNYRRGSHGVFYDTIKERKFRGIAATSGVGRVEWTALYSKEELETGDEDEVVVAANVQGSLGARWRAGLTFCRTDRSDEPAVPGQGGAAERRPVDNLGVYWRGSRGCWHVTGEVAGTDDGDLAAYAELERIGGFVGLRASLRHYGEEFTSPQGAPYADADGTPDAANETGVYLEAKTMSRQWYAVRGSCDLWGTAALDSLKGELTAEAVAWWRGWEVSGRVAHRREALEGDGDTTGISSRLRWKGRGVTAQAYGRMARPGGTGHVELYTAVGLPAGLGVAARAKADLGRRVGGTSWHEVVVTGQPWGIVGFRVAHRLGWERNAYDRHTRWQVLRAELTAAF